MNNPIPFNPDTMPLKQVRYCAETLRTLFEMLDRDASPEDIASYLKMSREYIANVWSKK